MSRRECLTPIESELRNHVAPSPGMWHEPLKVVRLIGEVDDLYPDGYLLCKCGKPWSWWAEVAERGSDGGLYTAKPLSKDITRDVFAWCEVDPGA